MGALLCAESLRVDVADVPAIDGLSLQTNGDRVLLLGAARAFFQAAAGLRRVAHGSLLVEGSAPLAASRAGVASCAPLDPPLPRRWTLAEYVVWSARLAGHSHTAAVALAVDALGRMHLAPLARTRLASAAPTTRRATVVAAALATAPRTLLIEDPLCALSPEDAQVFAVTLVQALADRRWAVFAPSVPRESALASEEVETIVIDGSYVAAQGSPSGLTSSTQGYAVRVAGDVAAFVSAVRAEGAHLVDPPPNERPARLSVYLGPLRTRDVLRIAIASSATVLELRPLPQTDASRRPAT